MSASRAAFMAIVGLALVADGQTNTAPAIAAASIVASSNAPVAPTDLPKGASDVVKLFQMGKKEPVLIFYINYSGLDYHLSANDVLYLKAVGLSSGVIDAMMEFDKERQKALAVRSDDDRYFGRTDSPDVKAQPAAVATVAASGVVQTEARYIPSVIYPDYSAFPSYYQTFDNSDHHHVSVAIGIGVGAVLGFGDVGFRHGNYGHGHFGGRH